MSGKLKLKVTFNSPVIIGFTSICLLALVLDFLTNGKTNNLLFSVYKSSMLDPLTYVRFIGHIFGHADISHFMGNIMLILVVGPLLEEKYGSWNIGCIIFITALVTGVANVLIFPHVQLLGASGVVFALILLSSITGFKSGEIPLTFILVALIYIGEQIYLGLFADDNISNFTHILGGAVGSVTGYALNKKK